MKQSINFLNNIPAAPNYLPAKWLGFGLLLLLITLMIISLSHVSYDYYIYQTLKQAKAERVEAERAFQTVANAYPLFAKDKPLVEQVTELEQQFREKQDEFDELTHTTLRVPFSKYLVTLAEIAPQGLWFDRIYINQDSENISLSGYSMLPVFVSELLQKLQKAHIFKSVYFDLFYVRKVSDKEYIQFEVANDRLLGPREEEDKEKKDESEDK